MKKTQTSYAKKSVPFSYRFIFLPLYELEGGAGSYQLFAQVVAGELMEVGDETLCKIARLFVPLLGVAIRIAWIEDTAIYAGQLGRHEEVEVRHCFRGSLIDASIQNSVNNGARILNRDTFAGSVPSGINEVSLGTYHLHFLNQFFAVLSWMQR